jgi:hypothetical protein
MSEESAHVEKSEFKCMKESEKMKQPHSSDPSNHVQVGSLQRVNPNPSELFEQLGDGLK